MANDKVTSLEVAALAGVSQSAVSRVFTFGSSVSPKTAEKVRAAAEKLGYRPNVLARSLKSGRSRIIGLLVAYLENYFYPEVVEKLSRDLQKEGYHVLVFLAPVTTINVGEEGLKRSDGPPIPEGATVRLWSRAQNANLRELCVELYGLEKAQ